MINTSILFSFYFHNFYKKSEEVNKDQINDIKEKYNAAYILLKPAPPGSGIIAGGPMRVVLDSAGIRDVVGKILGTKNKISNV